MTLTPELITAYCIGIGGIITAIGTLYIQWANTKILRKVDHQTNARLTEIEGQLKVALTIIAEKEKLERRG